MSSSSRVRGWCVGSHSVGSVLAVALTAGGLLFFGVASSLSAQTSDDASTAGYEVRPGDTLWQVAANHLNDGNRWREIFELNQDVVPSPDKLKPGTRLRLPADSTEPVSTPAADAAPAAVVVGVETRTVPRRAQEAQEAQRRGSRFGGESVFDKSPDSGDVLGGLDVETYAPPELVSSSDFYRAAYMVERTDSWPLGHTARKIQENPTNLRIPASVRLNNRVVLALNGIDARDGDMLQAFSWGRKHGSDRVAHPVAMVEITETQGDSARGVVRQLFGDYQVGDPVVMAPPFESVGTARVPSDDGLVTELLSFRVSEDMLGAGDQVFLGAGSDNGVRLGDEFAVFSKQETRPADARLDDRLIVVRVIHVSSASSTARVVEMLDAGTSAGAPARRIASAAGG